MSNLIILPDYNNLTNLCIDRMIEKYPMYGNTWHESLDVDGFFDRQIYERAKKIRLLITDPKNNNKQIQKEIIDLINMLAMTHTELDEK